MTKRIAIIICRFSLSSGGAAVSASAAAEHGYFFFSGQPSGIAASRSGTTPAFGFASLEPAFEETPTLWMNRQKRVESSEVSAAGSRPGLLAPEGA